MALTSLFGESVSVARTSARLTGLVDPAERKIYFSTGADVQRGDVLTLRGWVRRVTDLPQTWANRGVVVTFEDGPSWLPDTGTLERKTGTTFDPASNQNVPVWTTKYTGPCRVDATPAKAGGAELGEQLVQLQPYSVLFPLSLVDVEPGDRLTVTSSRDGRLLVRTLFVQRTLADSQAQDRVVLMREEQS